MDEPTNPSGLSARQSDAAHVARLMYASRANTIGSIYAVIERIRASAIRHNEPAGVATALLYQSGWFAQWKEGPKDALIRIMERVEADPRHHSMRIVHSSRGPRILSGPWSTAIVQSEEPSAVFAERVAQLRREMEIGMQCSPQTAWRRLSTPMRHPGVDHQAEPDAFQRVLVCAADGMGSFHLVHWLGRLHQEEVVHRRFAGARELDVGTDYVDFAGDARIMRVIAMARHGLTLPLTRAFLPDYSHVVLLLCGDPARDQALLYKVVQACVGLVAPPALLGVGQSAAHPELFALARRFGMVYLDAECRAQDEKTCWSVIEPLLAGWRHAVNSEWPLVPLRA